MTRFDDTLWERLSRDHAAETVTLAAPRRGAARRPLVISAGAAGLAAVVVVVVLTVGATTATPPAYALTNNPDGTVTVTINDIETAIPALNAEFRADGIDETVIPVVAGCPTPGITSYPGATPATTITLTPGRKDIDPGYDFVLAAEQLPDGSVGLLVGALPPPLPSCFSPTAVTILPVGPGADASHAPRR